MNASSASLRLICYKLNLCRSTGFAFFLMYCNILMLSDVLLVDLLLPIFNMGNWFVWSFEFKIVLSQFWWAVVIENLLRCKFLLNEKHENFGMQTIVARLGNRCSKCCWKWICEWPYFASFCMLITWKRGKNGRGRKREMKMFWCFEWKIVSC